MERITGTRDTGTIRQWAYNASGGELRAALDEAKRDGDTEVVEAATRELRRRGLIE